MDTVAAFLVGILSSLAAVGLLNYKRLFEFFPKTTRLGYLNDLKNKIKQMPFIYKDLDTDVINDFVDVEFQSLDLGTLRLKESSKTLIASENEKLKHNRNILFLGNAGIGKTTFQRRTILTIINNARDSRIIYHQEKPVPIYVPLKAVDNSEPYPILRYIENNNLLFANFFGLRKFNKLARSKKLFLFLDGYDEIPFTGGTHNFVQEELGMLLGTSKPNSETYKNLAKCRVWLSSRKEFFEKNPISNLDSGSTLFIREEGLAAIELKGIGNNRIKLARKIFDKYRNRSKNFYEFLNEEYFLFEIDNSDDEIKQLSFNPLFLTVMCYIYAQKAVDQRNHKVEWAKKFDELIIECVEILLIDLDENKARDLPEVHKEALLTRRNLFVEEKKLFLQFFSIQLYFDNKPVFTLSYLKDQIRKFFDIEYPLPLILDDLNSDNSSKPNIALQLVYQGIFVFVDRNKDEVFYDFPHRRFREVLASKYINTPQRYERLLANAEGKQFGEFLPVFFKSESYNDINFHNETLKLILEKSLGYITDDFFVRITFQFEKLKPLDYNPNEILENFLSNAILSDKLFNLSEVLFKKYKISTNFFLTVKTELVNASKTLNYNRFYTCVAILGLVSYKSLDEILLTLVNKFLHDRNILPVIFQYLTLFDLGTIQDLLVLTNKSKMAFYRFVLCNIF